MTGRRIVKATLAVYAVLAALGLGWAAFRGRPWIVEHPAPWWGPGSPYDHLASLAAGAGLAGLTLALSRFWVRRYAWAKELHLGFREILGGLDARAVAVIALSSGIGEELFFRGALQPSIGWIATSLIFGLVHVGPDRRFRVWTLWAVAMGFALGAIHEATGSLLGPILAHVWINYENLQLIATHDPRAPEEHVSDAPRLVGRHERR